MCSVSCYPEATMDLKLILAIAATALGLGASSHYLVNMLRGQAQPHAYTWLIWFITSATAAGVILTEGGGLGGLALAVGTLLTLAVFVLSFRYGTRNITRTDTTVLIAALAAVIVWWRLHAPLAALLMVTAIDTAGYIPTWRKSFEEPWSETVWSWVLYTLSNLCSLLALQAFNALTATYIVATIVANVTVIAICLARRPVVARATAH